MKILEIDFRAIGPFTNQRLDLSAGDHGFHLVYGTNEAGKTSALQALRQALFGMDQQGGNFLHRDIRVGATLTDGNGRQISFLRRRTRSQQLRDASDRQVIDESELHSILGSVDQSAFLAMFGIDHPALRRGGQDLVRGEGDVASTLFAAGAGLSSLRNVQQQLRKEFDSIYLHNGRNQRIPERLKKLADVRARINQEQLSADDWGRHRQVLDDALAEKASLDQLIRADRRELGRLSRLQYAIPLAARRAGIVEELKSLVDAPRLPSDFSRRRLDACISLQAARVKQTAAEEAIRQIDAEMASLDPDAARLIAESDTISSLHRRLGEYEKGTADRPGLVSQLQLVEHEIRESLRNLKQPIDTDVDTITKPRADIQVRIQVLHDERQRLATAMEYALKGAAAARRAIEESSTAMARIADVCDVSSLRRLVDTVATEGPLETRIAEEQDRLALLEQKAAKSLRQLLPWTGTPEELEALVPPDTSTVERFEQTWTELTQRRKHLAEEHEKITAAVVDLQERLRQLDGDNELPSEQDLRQARRERDQQLQRLRHSAGLFPDEQVVELARSIQLTDELSDRLRHDADRVATKGNYRTELDRKLADQKRSEARRVDADQEWTALEKEWRDRWLSLAIQPTPPREMRAWLTRYQEAMAVALKVGEQRELIATMTAKVERHIAAFQRTLAQLSAAALPPGDGLAGLLAVAQQMLADHEANVREKRRIQEEVSHQQRLLREQEDEASRIEKELRKWQPLWAETMQEIQLEPEALAEQALAITTVIQGLFQNRGKAREFQGRINGIDRDTEQYRADLTTSVEHLAPDLVGRPVGRMIGELSTRLQRARESEAKRADRVTQRRRYEEQCRKVVETVAEITGELDAMCREAGCRGIDDLPAVEERAARRATLEARLTEVEDEMARHSAGASLDTLLAEISAIDADLLSSQLAELEERLAKREQQRSTIDQTIGREEVELRQMESAAGSAAADLEAEGITAALVADTRQYAVLRAASFVLEKAIENYRSKNQDPLLARASNLFRELTVGSFCDLRADLNDHGKGELRGVRLINEQEELVPTSAMSDGSCDQLYLALKLASLHQYLDQHEPMPLIVDDILVNFDDRRAAAALRAFGELSRRTQVIFFTHHQHLLDVAKQELPEGMFFTHELPARHPSVALSTV